MKHWVLHHYLWIALGLLIVALAMTFVFQPETWTGWIAILGIPATFLVTIQRLKTEELKLFRELFKEFNGRYDALHERLYDFLDAKEQPPDKVRNLLFDYFNLCGEEFFYYSLGYIYPEVWKAWYNGMLRFLQDPRIREFWDVDSRNDSYYGLTFPKPPNNGSNSNDDSGSQNPLDFPGERAA